MKISLCTPSRPVVIKSHMISMFKVEHYLQQLGHEVQFHQTLDNPLLEHARSIIASDAHEWGADVQLWVDDDIEVILPDNALQLCLGALETQSVVAAPVPIGGGSRWNVTFLEDNPWNPTRLVKATDVGMGYTAIHRRVFELLSKEAPKVEILKGAAKVWPFFRSIITDEKWLGEDVSFCVRAQEAMNGCCYTDTRVTGLHFKLKAEKVPPVLI